MEPNPEFIAMLQRLDAKPSLLEFVSVGDIGGMRIQIVKADTNSISIEESVRLEAGKEKCLPYIKMLCKDGPILWQDDETLLLNGTNLFRGYIIALPLAKSVGNVLECSVHRSGAWCVMAANPDREGPESVIIAEGMVR